MLNIKHGDSPRALLVIAGIGGVLTTGVLILAFAGSVLAATGAPSARAFLITAALTGLVTAMPLWIPAGIVIGAAAILLGHPAAPALKRAEARSGSNGARVAGDARQVGAVRRRRP